MKKRKPKASGVQAAMEEHAERCDSKRFTAVACTIDGVPKTALRCNACRERVIVMPYVPSDTD